ncbi:release factor glutamine methyltransferase [Paramicrobacterium humi]|uniref:peptide chain release factor N(5)-glutamine methyltransferase n=1 Tax=Paramicrobacterium humi TaxID=640635 RepID=A0A1H4JYX0_9MICO|nr:putative protein N(5)-glutamine methyltransferase [Microbacterium humi]SEB51484.1 release factor glutamine methyltransferase [Microbacterium humi]
MTAKDAAQLASRLRAAGCVFAEDEAALFLDAAAAGDEELGTMVARRIAGEAPEHIVGWAEFCGLRVRVAPGVFIPRRRTGALVEQAARLCSPGSVVVDVCCGSGAIARVLAERHPDIESYAADLDPVAVACARENLAGHGAVFEGDLFDALPARLRGRVDVLVANVPYVPSAELRLMPAEAREHEPAITHDGGSDGLAVFRRLVAAAPGWLAPGGSILSEINESQADAALAALQGAELSASTVVDDELESTVVIGVRG